MFRKTRIAAITLMNVFFFFLFLFYKYNGVSISDCYETGLGVRVNIIDLFFGLIYQKYTQCNNHVYLFDKRRLNATQEHRVFNEFAYEITFTRRSIFIFHNIYLSIRDI